MNVISLAGRRLTRRTTTRRMKRKKTVRAQILPFPLKSLDERRPSIGRDALALFPLLDRISGPTDIRGHLRERLPGVKNISDRSHGAEYAPDELSVQGPTMIPMTEIRSFRTIRPMGRGVTPTKVRSEIAKRLKSARIVAGYATQREAADALGIRVDRYEKWESGRTPVPAQYVGPVCALFNIDANYLFGVEAAHVARKVV